MPEYMATVTYMIEAEDEDEAERIAVNIANRDQIYNAQVESVDEQ